MTSTGLYAGAGRASIQILGSVFPVDGFAGEHDKLAARVLLLDSRGQRLVLVVVDQTSMSADSVTRLRSVVAAECRAEQNNVFISAAHTFSAPHVSDPSAGTTAERAKNDSLRAAVQDAVLQAAVAARRSLRPALIGPAKEAATSMSTAASQRRRAGGTAPTRTAFPTRPSRSLRSSAGIRMSSPSFSTTQSSPRS